MLRYFAQFKLSIFLLLMLCLIPLQASYARSAAQFESEQQAKQHCPNDTVVWVNTKTGVYHFKGQRWFGNTREGAFECIKEANDEGDRATRNGQ